MLRRLATASRKLVEEAIVEVVLLFCLVEVVEVNVRWVRRSVKSGSLAAFLVRGEVNGLCRRVRMVLVSVGSSGAAIAVWGS